MININTTDLNDAFLKIYSSSPDPINYYCLCDCIDLLGFGQNKPFLCMPISPKTQLAIRVNNENSFKIIDIYKNTMYECETENLSKCNEKADIKRLFNAISIYKGNIKGAQILFSNSVNEKAFCDNLLCLCTALRFYNSSKFLQKEELKALGFCNDFNYLKLFLKKNTLLYADNINNGKYFTFNLTGINVIIISSVNKLNIKNETEKILGGFFAKNTALTSKILSNIQTHKTINDELFSLLSNIDNEIFKYNKEIKTLVSDIKSAIKKTNLSLGSIISYNHSGVCAFVKEENTDLFIKTFSDIYKESSGEVADFYICKTSQSNISNSVLN